MATAEERFTVLYERHYDHIERYVRRRAPDAAVRDVVADVFLVVWRRLRDVPDEPLPWLYGVARRVLANEVRGLQRGRRLVERAGKHTEDTAADHADDVARRLTVAAAFDRLADSDQEALRLVAWEGLGVRDAAKAAGCSVTAFGMRLHRARRRLRRELGGVTSEPDTTCRPQEHRLVAEKGRG